MNSMLPIPLHFFAIKLHLLNCIDIVRYIDLVEVIATSLADEISVICWRADRHGGDRLESTSGMVRTAV